MEKQIQAISENIEIKDLELNQVLKSLNIDPDQLGNIVVVVGIVVIILILIMNMIAITNYK